MKKNNSKRLFRAYVLFIPFFHVLIYYMVCVREYFGFGIIYNTVFFVTNFPWIAGSAAGFHMYSAPMEFSSSVPSIVRIFAALSIRPNIFGILTTITFWSIFYIAILTVVTRLANNAIVRKDR